jgi:TPR repeat protein
MPLRFTVVLVLLIVCLAAPAWADFRAGLDAYNRSDYATALREWRPLAEQGDTHAQYNLGVLYLNGQGVPQDDVRACMWFSLAAARPSGDFQMRAAGNRDKVARRMTPAQMAEAQRLTQQCQWQGLKGC